MSTIRDVVILAVFSGVVGLCSIVFSRFWHDSIFGLPKTSKEDNLTTTFPGYFRNQTEEKEFENETRNAQALLRDLSTPTDQKSCMDGDCEWDTIADSSKTTSPNGYTYNACCRSKTEFQHPKKLRSAMPGRHNKDVYLVQKWPHQVQYFSIQKCTQITHCTHNCTCSQTHYVTTAVVYRGDRMRVEWVHVKGCCQCLNHQETSENVYLADP